MVTHTHKKIACFPLTIKNKTRMYTLTTSILHCTKGSSEFIQARKRNKVIQIRKEGVKPSLSTDNEMAYVNGFYKINRISEFSKVSEFKFNTQSQLHFLTLAVNSQKLI